MDRRNELTVTDLTRTQTKLVFIGWYLLCAIFLVSLYYLQQPKIITVYSEYGMSWEVMYGK